MTEQVHKNCKLYYDKYDLSGNHNELKMNYSAEAHDITQYGATARSKLAGLKSVELASGGYWQGGDAGVDDVLFDNMGSSGKVLTVCPTTGADGERAFIMKSVSGEYAPGESIGNVFAFNFAAYAQSDLVRSTVMATGSKTSSDNGTARQLGATGSGQSLYAALHVLSVSGTSPTLDVIVQSDSAENMASPTTQITFTQATAITAEWGSQAGAITDDWIRVSWTIGGSDTPTFNFIVSVGIL